MPEQPDRPDWLVPGAPVLVYENGGGGLGRTYSDVCVTTVRTVGAQHFTVESADQVTDSGRPARFRVRDQSWDVTTGSRGFGGRRRHVILADTDQARRIFATFARENAHDRYTAAHHSWIQATRRGETGAAELDKVIAAAQRLRAQLPDPE